MGIVFGYNSQDTGFEFEVITMTANRRTHQAYRGLINGPQNNIAYASPYVFASSGEVLDVRDPSAPIRSGKFAVRGAYVLPVNAASPMMLSKDDAGAEHKLTLHVLDTATATEQRSMLIDRGHFSDVTDAVQADPSVVFFRAYARDRKETLHMLSRDDGHPLDAP